MIVVGIHFKVYGIFSVLSDPPVFGVVKLEIPPTRKFHSSMKRKAVVDGTSIYYLLSARMTNVLEAEKHHRALVRFLEE